MKKQKTKVFTLILLLLITSCAVTNTSVKPSVIPSKLFPTTSNASNNNINKLEEITPSNQISQPSISNFIKETEQGKTIYTITKTGLIYGFIYSNLDNYLKVSLDKVKITARFANSDNNWQVSTLTNKNGYFEFKDIPVGFSISINTPPNYSGGILDTYKLNGKIYDIYGKPVNSVKVEFKFIDNEFFIRDEIFTTKENGYYSFNDVIIGPIIEITATKEGWTKRTRMQVLSGYNNTYDFGGPTDTANIYAIQDNPEVTSLKINGKIATNSDLDSTFPLKQSNRTPDFVNGTSLIGIDSNNIVIEMSFSEPVKRESVEDNFRIVSTSLFNTRKSSFVIDKKTSWLNFTWSDTDDYVKIEVTKPILSNFTGDEARYLVDFINPFKDKNNIPATPERAFKFSPSKSNDFCVFSVKNQERNLFIPNIKIDALKDGSNNDLIKINFNIQIEPIEFSDFSGLLSDPYSSFELRKQIYAYNTNNSNGNNATVLGYTNSLGIFKAVYVIGLLKASDLKTAISNKSGTNLKLKQLGGNFINYPTQYTGTNSPLNAVNASGKTITLELNPQAFEKGDILILSAGNNIDTGYNDTKNSVFVKSLTPNLNLSESSTFAKFSDPLGYFLDSKLKDTSGLITTSNSQKFTMVN